LFNRIEETFKLVVNLWSKSPNHRE